MAATLDDVVILLSNPSAGTGIVEILQKIVKALS